MAEAAGRVKGRWPVPAGERRRAPRAAAVDFTAPHRAERLGCGMLKLERVALELLEFKVDALAKQRSVRGGVSNLWALQRAVERGIGGLDSGERERLVEVSRRLRALAELPTISNRRPATDLDALRIDGGHRAGVDGMPCSTRRRRGFAPRPRRARSSRCWCAWPSASGARSSTRAWHAWRQPGGPSAIG
jgi:hypothetical protein